MEEVRVINMGDNVRSPVSLENSFSSFEGVISNSKFINCSSLFATMTIDQDSCSFEEAGSEVELTSTLHLINVEFSSNTVDFTGIIFAKGMAVYNSGG